MAENHDKRYPAAFQRGYTGQRAASASSGSGRPNAASSSAPTGDSPAMQPGQPVVEPRAAASGTFEGSTFEREPRGNPFIAALWILAPVFATAGVWLVVWAQTMQTQGYPGDAPLPYLVIQVAYLLSGPLTTAGLGGIFGLLFWHAAAWRRRAIARSASGH